MQAILGGCACFWVGVLVLGVVYIGLVIVKRSVTPEEVRKRMRRVLS